MLDWKEERVLANIRKADTDDLLDRITAYRAGMEPNAIDMVETELRRRNVTDDEIKNRQAWCEETCLFDERGCAKMCALCRRPAVREGWRWHKLLGRLPLFPRWMTLCQDHWPLNV